MVRPGSIRHEDLKMFLADGREIVIGEEPKTIVEEWVEEWVEYGIAPKINNKFEFNFTGEWKYTELSKTLKGETSGAQ